VIHWPEREVRSCLAGLLADYTGFIELLDATHMPSMITSGYWSFEQLVNGAGFSGDAN
jgi:hypothetical protein